MNKRRMLALGLFGGAAPDVDVDILPSDISTLKFWAESDFGTYQDAAGTIPAIAGDPVWKITERKNGYNLNTTNNNYRPLLTVDDLGQLVIVFDGVDDGMRVDFPRSVPETIFVVCKELSTDNASRVLLSTHVLANATHDMFGVAAANTLQVGSNVSVITAKGLSDAYHIWSYVENNTASRIHRDGTLDSLTGTGNCAAVNANGLAVGCAGNWLATGSLQSWCHNVAIKAILVFDGILSPSEHNQMGKYLADKFSLKFYRTISNELSDNSLATVNLLKSDGVSRFKRPSPNSRGIYQTTATRLYLEIYNTANALFSGFDGVGIRVNGSDYTVVMPGADGTVYKTVDLPAGLKTVEIINGFQHAADLAGPIGVYALGASFNAPFTIIAGPATPRLLVYGDSIAVGARAVGLPLTGWVQILKNSHTGTVINESWSSRSFWDDCSDAGKRTTFAAQIAADTPSTILLAIGCNDRNLINSAGHWVNEAGFASAYGDFLDKVHAALPSAVIYAQTPIITASEAAGIISVRSGVTTAQSSRSAFCTLVDGPSIMSVAYLDDELHPNTAGQSIMGEFYINLLGL